jgi:hypothetical protein
MKRLLVLSVVYLACSAAPAFSQVCNGTVQQKDSNTWLTLKGYGLIVIAGLTFLSAITILRLLSRRVP